MSGWDTLGFFLGVLPHFGDVDHGRPLEGVKVVELTLAIAGPSTGAVLADYGALHAVRRKDFLVSTELIEALQERM